VVNGRRAKARRGSTLDGHTRPSAIAARDNFARYNPNSWLDIGGALQELNTNPKMIATMRMGSERNISLGAILLTLGYSGTVYTKLCAN
jgi:hypothetical protein